MSAGTLIERFSMSVVSRQKDQSADSKLFRLNLNYIDFWYYRKLRNYFNITALPSTFITANNYMIANVRNKSNNMQDFNKEIILMDDFSPWFKHNTLIHSR